MRRWRSLRETTLCYPEMNGRYLMLHRNRKPQDPNAGKWIGIGGGIEPNETPDDCLRREFFEETGLTLTVYRYRGLVRFRSDVWPDEDMHLYSASGWSGEMGICDEGDLEWVAKERLRELPLWEGDRIFLELLERDAPVFVLTLHYAGERLTAAELDGRALAFG